MLWDSLLLVCGLTLIIFGGDWFVSASVRIAEMLRMPRIVIGSTLVSITTTSPEMVVSVMAGLEGESGLAVGNAVGSCICNMGLILGFIAACKRIDVHPPALRMAMSAMFLFGFLLLAISLDLVVDRTQGILLIALGTVYFVYDFIRHVRHPKKTEEDEANVIESERLGRYPWLQTGLGTTAQFLVGALVVIFGSKLLVESAVGLASALGIPSIIIGLTVVALGTSLPELVTAITSARKNVSDLAIGNILGANIANITLIVGTAATVHEVTMQPFTQRFNFPAMLFFMALVAWVILSDRRITRREGGVLLGAYGLYIGALVTLTVMN